MGNLKNVLENINFNSNIEKYESKSKTDLISKICHLQINKEYLKLLECLVLLLSDSNLLFEHPSNSEILTRPRFSSANGGTNFIIFTDKNNENPWILVQSLNFADAIITEKKKIFITQTGKNNLDDVKAKIERQVLSSICALKDWSKSSFEGLYIHQPRPFHNIYDMHLVLFGLSKLEPRTEVPEVFLGESFLDLNYCGLSCSSLSDKSDKILLLCVAIERNYFVDSNRHRAKGVKIPYDYRKLVHEFEAEIFKFNSRRCNAKLPSLKIWFGITGQKRAWLEQVEGLSNIIKNLQPYFYEIEVYIDGMTAPEGQIIRNRDDELVFSKIVKKVNNQCQIYSIIGCDYRKKIELCSTVDVFIANAGTGCVVPLRFCNKPGVLHSNSTLFTFPDDYDSSFIKTASYNHIVNEESDSFPRGDYKSYHIPWQHIFNLSVEVINKVKGTNIKLLDVPPVKELAKKYNAQKKAQNKAIMSFMTIEDRVELSHKSPDILREVALSFEQSGDIETALKIMQKALELRPSGPFIKKKVDEYTQLLQEKGNQP